MTNKEQEKVKRLDDHSLLDVFGLTVTYKTESGMVITEAPTPIKSWWMPNVHERQLITQLLHGVSKGEKPLLLDVACGTGLTTEVLARNGSINAIGIDTDGKRLRDSSERMRLLHMNAWEAAIQFGPVYDQKNDQQRRARLRRARRDDNFLERRLLLTSPRLSAVRRLQESIRNPIADSPADVVLCSFMPTREDLTIPVRDGIHPKAIVYIRGINGIRTGKGTNYDPSQSTLPQGRLVSFDPGSNYYLAARFPTFCRYNFDASVVIDDNVEPNTPPSNEFACEVIIHLRHNVKVKQTGEHQIARYPFDRELEDMIRASGLEDEYFKKLQEAHAMLFRI